MDDVTIQFILVRGSDGVVRIAFNTCQVCNPSPNAYFVQKGDYFECQNCGAKFHIDDLGIISGGCNPTPVIEKTETENKIIIDKTYVESFKNKFVNWNCSVDSEIDLKQPIEQIAKFVKTKPNCHFHTDASQSIGKVKVDFTDVDLVTVAPHKFYGLNGFGILIKKKSINLIPQISGGRSTTVFRSGTPCLSLITSCDKALDIALKNITERYEYIKKLSDKIKNSLSKYENVFINNTENSIPHIINFSIKNIKSLDIQKALENNDIYVSTKISCCPVLTPSKLVYVLTKDKSLAASSLRVSLSHLTTEDEVNTFIEVFDKIYKEFNNNGKI